MKSVVSTWVSIKLWLLPELYRFPLLRKEHFNNFSVKLISKSGVTAMISFWPAKDLIPKSMGECDNIMLEHNVAVPFPKSKSGHHYLLVIMNYCSLAGIGSDSSSRSSNCFSSFIDHWIRWFRVPLEFLSSLSYQGVNFESQVFQKMGSKKLEWPQYVPNLMVW